MTPNITKIIQTMSNIVADVMTSFQSDFENFDRPYIENAYNSKFSDDLDCRKILHLSLALGRI